MKKIPIVKEPFPHGGLPGKGRMAGEVRATPEEAKAEGYRAIREYEAKDRFGNMGVFIGVAEVDGGYRAVINLYHSNT
jgi:hypothetical protein